VVECSRSARSSSASRSPAPSRVVVASLDTSISLHLARAEHARRHLVELDADVLARHLAAGEDGDVLQVGLAVVAGARRLHRADLDLAAQLVRQQRQQRLGCVGRAREWVQECARRGRGGGGGREAGARRRRRRAGSRTRRSPCSPTDRQCAPQARIDMGTRSLQEKARCFSAVGVAAGALAARCCFCSRLAATRSNLRLTVGSAGAAGKIGI
jgi:hypothetical protein